MFNKVELIQIYQILENEVVIEEVVINLDFKGSKYEDLEEI